MKSFQLSDFDSRKWQQRAPLNFDFLDQHFWSFKIASVRPLRPSVRHKSSHTSHHYFFLLFCNKLACYKCRKVTKPDFCRKIRNFFYKQFFKKSSFWPFSRERCISFGYNCIFRQFSALSTTFLLTLWSGKIIFTDFSVILSQFLAKLCDFQIPFIWDLSIFMVWFQHPNEVFLALFHLRANCLHEKFSILRFRLTNVVAAHPPKF